MHWLLIFSFAFNFISSFTAIYFSYRIMRLDVTPSFTWSIYFAVAVLQLVQMIWTLFAITDIQLFISQYPPAAVVTSYVLGGLRSGLVMAFVARVYFTLKAKFPWTIPL